MTPSDELHVATPADLGRWRIPAIAFIVVVVLGSVALAATRGPWFHAETIRVHGVRHLGREEALGAAGIDGGTNVFTLDAPQAERRIEADPWVISATITKHLPTTIVIDVREHVAVAVTDSVGVPRLVAEDGSLLDVAVATNLPVIAWTDTSAAELPAAWIKHAAQALAAMEPDLRRQVSQVAVLADGQLRVDLRSGAEVMYGPAVELSAKADALRLLLRWAAEQGTPVVAADVRVPTAPTARFG